MIVADIMTKDVVTISPDTHIDRVATLLFDRNLTGMPVVDDQSRVVGIVTEYDLMNPEFKVHIPTYINFLKQLKVVHDSTIDEYKDQARKLVKARVADIMTRDVITVQPSTQVTKLVELISKFRINPIPVVDDSNILKGIVSRADLVKIFKESSLA